MIFLLVIILFYCLTIVYFAFIFSKTKQINSIEVEEKVVSILIPFKNEEKNLKNILEDIIKQDYPKEKLEVIFINDNSTDAGAEIVNSFAQKHSFIKLLCLQGEFGKKNALKKGVVNSSGEIIVHTDADVSFGKNWIKSILSSFSEGIVLSFGSVVFEKEKTIFEKLQSIELLSLTGFAASSAIIKHPVLISGANLAYKKELKQDFVDSINNIASGDDMFFLERIKKLYKGKINYIKNKDNIVHTKAESTLISFVNQRIRWAGKTKKIKDSEIIFAGLLSFFANISILILLVLSFFYNRIFNLFFIAITIKFIFELFSISVYSSYFNKSKYLFLFPILFVVYPFYIIGISVISPFIRYRWK